MQAEVLLQDRTGEKQKQGRDEAVQRDQRTVYDEPKLAFHLS